jgi:hypothetical protein
MRLIFAEQAWEDLRAVLQEEIILAETPMEVWTVMDVAVETLDEVCRRLKSAASTKEVAEAPVPGRPTRQQGQFLAFIREYMTHNYTGVGPTYVEFQRFFNLTAPSVNSMLIRLEQQGFIRRTPQRARGIELTIAPELIPPLERPFKF